MATHASILAWEIPWTEEPEGLQSIGLQKSQTQLDDQTRTTATNVEYVQLPEPVNQKEYQLLGAEAVFWGTAHCDARQ